MEEVDILKQAIEIALGSGAFKKTNDVYLIHVAMQSVESKLKKLQDLEAESSAEKPSNKKISK